MLTVREAFQTHYLLNHPQLAIRTLERYRMEVARWERLTDNPTIDCITTETFNRFRAACLATGLKANTIESGVRTILQILRLCGPETERRQGLSLLPRIPFVGRPLREHVPMRRVPTVEQLRLACRLAGQAIWPPHCDQAVWWSAWIGFGFVTALRLTDMLTIPRSARQDDVVRWTAHKTGVEHIFVLPPWLLRWMHDLPEDGALLFPSKRLPCFVRRELRRVSDVAHMQRLTPHGIRRAGITEWSIVSDDCGKIIHGEGLGIRSRYVDAERKLRAALHRLPDLSRTD